MPPRRRIVVREYELITSDIRSTDPEAAYQTSVPWKEGRRLVYSDMMEL
jgi:hypothetical protein